MILYVAYSMRHTVCRILYAAYCMLRFVENPPKKHSFKQLSGPVDPACRATRKSAKIS